MRRWAPRDHEVLVEMWAAGASGPEIGARLGRTPAQVTSMVAWLRAKGEHAIPFRGRAFGQRRRRNQAAIPHGTGEVRVGGVVQPARIMDASGRVVALLDPLTRQRTPA